MKELLSFVLFLSFLTAQSQKKEVPHEILESIKKEVWIPFMESYAELDSDKLQSLHSQDIVRVLLEQNKVQSGQSYLDDFGGFLNQMEESGGKLGIAFALLTTAVDDSGNLAYQTGYYEFSSQDKEDQDLMVRGYGLFSVGLKKIEGSWKLFLDVDKRIDLTFEEFEKQKLVYRLDR